MTKNVKILLIILALFQIFIAANFELAHDEAYYWLFSKNLDWGYFDHPPVMAIIIKLFSFFPKTELSVRFGFILLQFITVKLLIDLVSREHQFNAILMFFAFPLASFVGLLALPDMPLLFFSSLYLWLLKKYLDGKDGFISLSLGITLAGLLLSKYHGILLIFFTLLAVPKLFKRKSFYLITLMTLVICLPHFMWQLKAEFITLKYHFFERPSAEFSFSRIFEYLGVQIALAGFLVGPIVWWKTIKSSSGDDFQRVLKFISVGTIIFFLISSFSKRIEANWTVFLAIPLIILATQSLAWSTKWPKILLLTSFSVVVLTRLLFIMPEGFPGPKRLKEFKGWEQWSKQVQSMCLSPILANTYQMASKLSFYLDLPIHAQNYHSRKNQFDLWPKDSSYYLGDEVCYLSDKREFQGTPILSPDGKQLYLVPKMSIRRLEVSK